MSSSLCGGLFPVGKWHYYESFTGGESLGCDTAYLLGSYSLAKNTDRKQ